MSEKIKLYYFDVRGLAEPIRLALTQAGVQFEDIRFLDKWPEYKAKMPTGQVPVLEVDGKQITQSMTILRFVGDKYGLVADDVFDRAAGDELATSWLDMYAKLCAAFPEENMQTKKEKYLQVIEDFVKPRLKFHNERLSHSKSGFLAGNKVTWADFAEYNFLKLITDYLRVSLSDYSHLDKFVQKIESLPKIKTWLQQHANAPWTLYPNPLA